MKKINKNLSIGLLFQFLLFPLFGNTLEDISNVSTPSLGITSSSVVLLWDDSYVPDFTKNRADEITRTYYIYKNGEKIGSTKQRSYPVYELSPSTTYTFSIRLKEETNNKPLAGNSIEVTTKEAGKIFDIKKCGAKGDGKKLDTKAFQKAIRKCTKGGKVLVPSGTYLLDHIELKSDMTLELQKGAVLSFIGYGKEGNYPTTDTDIVTPQGIIKYKKRYLISGLNIHNVSIIGEGIIHGNGETWWPHYKELTVAGGRPFMLGFIQSSNILVQGVSFHDPPAWNNHLLYADDILYSDVKFKQISTVQGHNADGIDADSSRHMLVVGCLFATQDDSFAIKSGKYFDEGNKQRRSTEYITVRDCVFDGSAASGATALGCAIGSEVSGGARHIVIKNCQFIDVASIVNIKTNRKRPYAVVEDVRVENISYTNTKFVEKPYNRAPIAIDMFYYGKYANPDSIASLNKTTPLFKDIHFKNIRIENTKGKFAYLRGMPEQGLKNINFENISGSAKEGIYGKSIESLHLINVNFDVAEGDSYTLENVANITQFSNKEAVSNSKVYAPYQSTQDTTLTLYANFYKPTEPAPILVTMHGWHGRAKKRSYDDIQPVLTKKWFLIQPDMRGRADSEGKQDANGWELQDIIDAVEYAKRKYPALIKNPDQISLSGGSGGGGNVLGLIGKFPDYFCAAVAEFPISDYGMWYKADYRKKEFRDEMETKGWIGGSPKSNPEGYASRGGLTTVENLNTPLALQHGEKDIRVQVEQSRAYMKKAKLHNKESLIEYEEFKGVGAFIKGAHWEGVTDEQMKRRRKMVTDHFDNYTKPIEIPRKGKFIVAGYLKTKHFEVIFDNVNRIGEVIYDLDLDKFGISSKSAKYATLRTHLNGKWTTSKINLNQ